MFIRSHARSHMRVRRRTWVPILLTPIIIRARCVIYHFISPICVMVRIWDSRVILILVAIVLARDTCTCRFFCSKIDDCLVRIFKQHIQDWLNSEFSSFDCIKMCYLVHLTFELKYMYVGILSSHFSFV